MERAQAGWRRGRRRLCSFEELSVACPLHGFSSRDDLEIRVILGGKEGGRDDLKVGGAGCQSFVLGKPMLVSQEQKGRGTDGCSW